jgi:hypothetical protein
MYKNLLLQKWVMINNTFKLKIMMEMINYNNLNKKYNN